MVRTANLESMRDVAGSIHMVKMLRTGSCGFRFCMSGSDGAYTKLVCAFKSLLR